MHIRTMIATTAILAVAPLMAAQAEPQILALITTDGAKPLTCAQGECYAEFTSFCMEPGRQSPAHITAYTPAAGADLTLVAITGDGREIRVPVPKLASFTSQRGFAAVRIGVPETVISELGAIKAAITVGPRVALLPVPMAKYKRPHKPAQIAAALGPNRVVGERIVDNGGRTADSARVLSYLINALPEEGRVDPATQQSLWQETMPAVPQGLIETGQRYAKRSYQHCLANLASDQRYSLRQCLQQAHDIGLWSLTSKYWRAVGPQS